MGTKLSPSAARELYRASSPDVLRSVALRDQTETHWREVMRHQPPGRIESWLRSQAVIAAMGAARCASLRRTIRSQRKKLEEIVCSASWFDSCFYGNATFPIRGMVKGDEQTQFSSSGDSMTASRTRRYYPPQNCAQESYLDRMTPIEALVDRYAAQSASAVVIERIRTMRARPESGQW